MRYIPKDKAVKAFYDTYDDWEEVYNNLALSWPDPSHSDHPASHGYSDHRRECCAGENC